ncbi:MAG TPA: DUF4416 family protein [Thermodesulfovibrionales bacterium]|nr:DUF4416 family protein [Thermodesulfovibrionales bacterium]
MGTPSPPESVILFVGALYLKEGSLASAEEKLGEHFGEVAMESPSSEWSYSDYYREEMGSPLKRSFIFFRKAIDPGRLADIKLLTNDIERRLSAGGRRTINLDPGYLTAAKVVLASTKNYSHRIYIGKGIYAEVTLIFREGNYQPHLFTYPDYASEKVREIFEKARNFLRTP